jgi:ribonuclease-3
MNDLQITLLSEKLGYRFNDCTLLVQALTHSSYANERKKSGLESNERLEFLGDSLLGMTVALLIYENKPQMSEGEMTKLRAELVCEKYLALIASALDLGSCLLLGRGEESGGGRSRSSLLADAFEAIIAAIYLDGGFESARQFVLRFFEDGLNKPIQSNSDYKTKLQEVIQLNPGQTHVYEPVNEEGPDHDKTFTVRVTLNGKAIGTGTGKSKKSAEQEAAKAALEKIQK